MRACLVAVALAFASAARADVPLVLHEQTQGGVTVRIEKVAIERVLNEPGWLARHFRAAGQEEQAKADGYFPARFVKVYLTVTGNFGTVKVELAKPATQLVNGQRRHAPHDWLTNCDTIAVPDDDATGYEVWRHIPAGADWQELFPNTIQVRAVNQNGQPVEFTFDDVQL